MNIGFYWTPPAHSGPTGLSQSQALPACRVLGRDGFRPRWGLVRTCPHLPLKPQWIPEAQESTARLRAQVCDEGAASHYVGWKMRCVLLPEIFEQYPECLGPQIFLPTFLLPASRNDKKVPGPLLPFVSFGELGSDPVTQDGGEWVPAFS